MFKYTAISLVLSFSAIEASPWLNLNTLNTSDQIKPLKVDTLPKIQWPLVRPTLYQLDVDHKESTMRRTEIVFLISLPFTMILNIAATGLVYYFATGDSNMQMPASLWGFAGGSALLFSGAIAWQDHQYVSEKSKTAEHRAVFTYQHLF